MKPCPAGLKAFLDDKLNSEITQIDLYTFTLLTGEVFRWTAGNENLEMLDAGFPPESINAGADRTFLLGPLFSRTKLTTKVGIEPAQLEVKIYPREEDTIGVLPFAAAVSEGLFDNALVEVDRVIAPLATTGIVNVSLGCLVWFVGNVAEVEIGATTISMTIKSMMNLLANRQWPPRIFHAGCNHVFGGTMCGYDRILGKNALGDDVGIGKETITAEAGSVQTGITATAFVPSVDPSPYVEGTITGVTGANAGLSRTISAHVDGVIALRKRWIYPVAVGDTFDLLPGCLHTLAACEIYQNLARYGGYPYIPPPEFAI
jgi:hypothetical protein